MEKSIYSKLLEIQKELKAPKGQRNDFGKYNYRSCEDILEAVKPLCYKNKVTLVLTDSLVNMGDRYYIRAMAILYDTESETEISNTAYAREEETKKGMDASQITGTASSYARKYALNGLFNIDDTKDADTNEYHKQTNKVESKNKVSVKDKEPLITEQQKEIIKKFCEENNIKQEFKEYLKKLNKSKMGDLTLVEASDFIKVQRGEN